MREDYIDSTPERDIYTSPTFEELDSSYDEITDNSNTDNEGHQELENDETSDK